MPVWGRSITLVVYLATGFCLWAQADETAGMYYQSVKGVVVGARSSDLIEITKRGETLILRVLPGGSESGAMERPIEGNYIHRIWYDPDGIHLIDANGDGRQEIVAITMASASLGGYLGIYGVEKGEIKPLLEFVEVDGRRLHVGGSQFYVEKTADGNFVRINLYGRWNEGDPTSHTHAVVEWDGKAFHYRQLPKNQRRPPPDRIRRPTPPRK